MSELEIRFLKAGMILSEDAYSSGGTQLIMPKGTVLDDTRIARLAFYGIKKVNADLPGVTGAKEPENEVLQEKKESSYREKLKTSSEFKKFKMDFEDSFIGYQRNINEVIYNNKPLDVKAMTEPVYDLIKDCYGPSNIFSMLTELRDYNDATYIHCINVALIAHSIGEWMHLDEEDKRLLTEAGLIHDIGKIFLPQELLNKKEPLTDVELTKLKLHPQLGYKAVQDQNINPHIKNTVLMHHERCDGSGYPRHLTINQIDPVARIISIADVYDAMTSERIYRKAKTPFYAVEKIEEEGFSKFDPKALMIFLDCISNTYIGNRVRLSDGEEGEVVYINRKHYSRPTIKISSNKFIDLSERKDLEIIGII